MSFGFDLRNVDIEQSSNGPLPAGNYTAKIEKIEKKSSKKNEANKYLNVMYKVCDMNKRNGAVFFDIVNVHNSNDDAQNIGRKRLKSMLISAGAKEENINELGVEWLVGKKVNCVIGIEKDSQYGDKNRVYQVLPASGNSEGEPESDQDKHVPSWL